MNRKCAPLEKGYIILGLRRVDVTRVGKLFTKEGTGIIGELVNWCLNENPQSLCGNWWQQKTMGS
jgi:hypothetical protein